MSSPGDLPSPGIESRSPPLQADSLLCEPPGKPRQKRNMDTNPYPPLCIQGTVAFLQTVRPSTPSLAVQCIAEMGWQPGPLLQCLHLDKCLLGPQNTKTLERTKNNSVHVQLGQTMDNKIQKDPKTTKCHF